MWNANRSRDAVPWVKWFRKSYGMIRYDPLRYSFMSLIVCKTCCGPQHLLYCCFVALFALMPPSQIHTHIQTHMHKGEARVSVRPADKGLNLWPLSWAWGPWRLQYHRADALQLAWLGLAWAPSAHPLPQLAHSTQHSLYSQQSSCYDAALIHYRANFTQRIWYDLGLRRVG